MKYFINSLGAFSCKQKDFCYSREHDNTLMLIAITSTSREALPLKPANKSVFYLHRPLSFVGWDCHAWIQSLGIVLRTWIRFSVVSELCGRGQTSRQNGCSASQVGGKGSSPPVFSVWRKYYIPIGFFPNLPHYCIYTFIYRCCSQTLRIYLQYIKNS